MQTLTTCDVTNALTLLAEAVAHHCDDTEKLNVVSDVSESDEENDSSCPVFDKFYNDGESGAIYPKTNFSPEKFEQIYSCIEEAL